MTIETLTNLHLAAYGAVPCEESLAAWEMMTLEEQLDDAAFMEAELNARADRFAWELANTH